MSDIEVSDIYHLIALASRISLPKSRGVELIMYRLFWFLPISNACSRKRKRTRCARLLDSLANLSVAAPQHEVMAVAFRPTASSIELLIAGNQQVPISTIDHIRCLWVSLQELFVDYRCYNQVFLLLSAARRRVKRFQRTALKFCGEKPNWRFVKHL